MNAPPILVTGAGGCIGAWVIKRLRDDGVPVVAYDLSADRRRLALLCDNAADADAVPWHIGDIADAPQFFSVVEQTQPRAMIHLAALQVPFCKATPSLGAQVNVVGTVNVFEAAKRFGIKRLSYASSVAATAMATDSEWLATLYGAYKVCNEQVARVYWQDERVASVGIRPSVIYGAARDQGMSAKPSLAMLAAAARRPYTIPFSGPVGFVYAAEAAAAFIQAVATDGHGAALFDLNGAPQTIAQVVEHIRRHEPQAAIDCRGAPLPFPADRSDAPLRAHIGDYEQTDFADGVAQTLALFHRRLGEGRMDVSTLLGELQ